MAQSRDGISTRIGLDAGDTKKELKEIGDIGEKAFAQIEKATSPLNASLSRLSGIMNSTRAGVKATADAFGPAAARLGDVHTATLNLGKSLTNVAGNIFPHFREVLAIGAVASAAGLLSLTRSAVDNEHQLSLNARQLGISSEAFKGYSKAALQAGIDGDTFSNAATRFNAKLQDTADQAQGSILKIVQLAVGENAKVTTVLNSNAKETGKLVSNIVDVFKQVQEIAPTAWQVMGDEARKSFVSVENLAQVMAKRLMEGGDAAKGMREEMAKWNVTLPSATVFEALNRQMPNFTNELVKMGFSLKDLVDPTTGRAKQFEEVFPLFLERFAQLGDVSKQSRVAMDLFGRAGVNMLSFLQRGKDLIKEYPAIFAGLGVGAAKGAEKIDRLKAAYLALDASAKLVKKTIGLAFADVFDPIIRNVTDLVTGSIPQLREWATGIANTAKPVVEDFINVLKNADAEVKNQWVKDFVNGMREFLGSLGQAMPSIVSFFGTVKSVFEGIANVINFVFGTKLNGTAVMIIAVIGTMSGAFAAIGAAITAVIAIVGALIAIFGGIFALAAGPAILLVGIVALVASFVDWQKAITNAWNTVKAFWDMIKAFGLWLGRGLAEALINSAISVENFFIRMYNSVINVLNKIKGAMAAISGQPFTPLQNMQEATPVNLSLAGGGHVRGKGTHWSDSILGALSDGEFVMRWAAVRKYGVNFMKSINSLSLPVLPKFALGGPVRTGHGLLQGAAGFSGTAISEFRHDRISVDLRMPTGELFRDMLAPRDVANSFGKYARQSSRAAIGRRPGWHSGRTGSAS